MIEQSWNYANVPPKTLNVSGTLSSGQCFRWRVTEVGEWRGVIEDLFVRIKPGANGFFWQTYPEPNQWQGLYDYFRMDVDLAGLIENWCERDPESTKCFRQNAGMRILNQPPREAFFSFLCASNNSIMKIRKSVSRLAERAGTLITEFEGQTYHRFPDATELLGVSVADLRSDMWGFRAPRVVAMAEFLSNETDWLHGLRALPYVDAHGKLTELFGIGAKLADCIALFGLGFDAAVPVDTHIRQIGLRKFGPQTGAKSLTANEYTAVAGRFRDLYGPYAGWAQQYLFFDELNTSTTQNKMAISPKTAA
ncbi:MAG: DNA glycosylase [Chthonomonadales bacterium]